MVTPTIKISKFVITLGVNLPHCFIFIHGLHLVKGNRSSPATYNIISTECFFYFISMDSYTTFSTITSSEHLTAQADVRFCTEYGCVMSL